MPPTADCASFNLKIEVEHIGTYWRSYWLEAGGFHLRISDSTGIRNSELLFLLRWETKTSLSCFDHWLSMIIIIWPFRMTLRFKYCPSLKGLEDSFSDSSVGKESTCRRPWFDPWIGKTPWIRERLPTPVFWPGEFHGLYSPWGHKESDMTEQLSLQRTVKHLGYLQKTLLKLQWVPYGGWIYYYHD